MAGDAAGLIAPLAGNGISMALDWGMLAAGYLERYLSGEISAENMRSEYPAAWEARFAGRLRLGRLLQPLLFRPHTAALVLKVINAFPPAGRFYQPHAPIRHNPNRKTRGENIWMKEPRIAGLAAVVPEKCYRQDEILDILKPFLSGNSHTDTIFAHAGIDFDTWLWMGPIINRSVPHRSAMNATC